MSAYRLKLNAEKTELMWAGTRHTVASFLRLHDSTTDTVKAADAVRVLGVLFIPGRVVLASRWQAKIAEIPQCAAC